MNREFRVLESNRLRVSDFTFVVTWTGFAMSPSSATSTVGVSSATGGDNNALVETVIGRFKAEMVHRPGLWRNRKAVEIAALSWVIWFNTRRRPFKPIGHVPIANPDDRFHAELAIRDAAA